MPLVLRALPGLRARMVDVLDSEVKLVFVPLRVAHSTRCRDRLVHAERQHLVIEQIRGRDRRLAIVQLGARDLRIGIDERLLVDAANALEIADIERILGTA